MDVAQRDVLGFGVVVVAFQPVEIARGQRGVDLAVRRQAPRVVVDRAAFGGQVVRADGELVRLMPQEKLGAMPRLFCWARSRQLLHHGVQAEGRVFAGDEVEVTRDAVRVARAVGVRGFVLVDQQGDLLTWLTTPPVVVLAEQHRGRALEHLNPVVVEGVALQQRGILHAVVVNVTGLAQREAAQTHVFLTRFACQAGYAWLVDFAT